MDVEPPAEGEAVRGSATWGAVLGALVVAVGFVRGLERLHDNSFLTHLATGRLILDEGIPRADPYSFTAAGEPWVVQSWLVSSAFALVEDLVGLGGIRVLVALLSAAIVGILWISTAGARSVIVRLGVAVLSLAALLPHLAERPLLVGLLGTGLCVLAIDDRLDPRWLVPMGWVWVSSHGSFPLGVAIAAIAAVGAWLDRADGRAERRTLGWLVVGIALGAVNPLGPRLLVFPVELLGRTDLMRTFVAEWQPFSLEVSGAVAVLGLVVLAVWALVRRRSWRDVGLVVVFCVAAAVSRRNIPVAVLVVAPVVARSLPALGTITSERRLGVGRAAVAAIVAGGAVATLASLGHPPTALQAYPVEVVDRLEAAGVVGPGAEARVATEDFVGNYLTARYGRDARVFIDDRYDMYPIEVIADSLALVRDQDEVDRGEILDRYDIDVVLWRRDRALEEWIQGSDRWTPGPSDEAYWVACRVGTAAADSACAGVD